MGLHATTAAAFAASPIAALAAALASAALVAGQQRLLPGQRSQLHWRLVRARH